MTELKPCPFCGGEAQVQHQSRELYGDAVDWYGVYCNKQFCGYVSGQSTEAEAIEAWNTRADDYRHAAEYWQRMYEEAFVERTCRMTDRGECSECGAYIVRAWTEVHDFNGDMKRIDLRSHNYCSNCGARVVSE